MLALPWLVAGCAGEYSTLSPAGPAAAQTAQLWWVMLVGAAIILIGVMGLAILAFTRAGPSRISEKTFLVGGGLIFPIVTMAALLVFALMRGEQLTARPDPSARVFEAHAVQWRWTFSYPGGEQTDDVLHVPAGEPFQVSITSEDVIHSFWVPRLGGKMDAIPGRANLILLKADAPGIYRGMCAEYCGIGHLQMVFEVHAHPPEAYAARLAEAAAQAASEGVQVPDIGERPAPISNRLSDTIRRLLQRVVE
ncbi:MAG: cytochrome c oxidase subunit II [Hyphomonas sp.]